MLLVGEFLFSDERIGVEPLQQIGCVGSDYLRLRIMDMRIDETGQNQVRAMVGDIDVATSLGTDFSIVSRRRMRPSSTRTAPSSI